MTTLLDEPPRIFFGQALTKKGKLKVISGNSSDVTMGRDEFARGHMHIRGRTRSGKTSRALIPLAKQLLTPYMHSGRVVQDPVFVFDLGGDQSFFWELKTSAENDYELKRKFRFLSMDEGDAWSYFDPFQAVGKDNVIRLANLFIEAFNLDNGLVYGGQYFTQQNLAALLTVARHLREQTGYTPNLRQIAQWLDQQKQRDSDQIRMTFNFLLEYPQLQPPPQQNGDVGDTINMRRAIEQGEVIYFFTPTLNESTTARQIAGLGLYSVINAAIQLQRSREKKSFRHIWVFVDEFQELAGRSFAALLAQAGKFGISLILANQTTSQLENRDASLVQIMSDNCHVKEYFTVTTLRDVEDLQALSKLRRMKLRTSRQEQLQLLWSEHEILHPKLTKNDILNVSATGGDAFLVVDVGSGHREPQRIRTGYSTEARLFAERSQKELPKGQKPAVSSTKLKTGPLPARKSEIPAATIPPQVARTMDPKRRDLLYQLLEAKMAAEKV